MNRGKGKQSGPKSAQDDLMSALQEMETQHQKKVKDAKKEPRGNWFSGVPGMIRTGLIVALILLVILVADGMRREAGEMTASLTTVAGGVTLAKGGGSPTTARANTELVNKDVITTAADGNATIVFPDGSAVQVEPNSQFEVRLLDFARGTQRDRSFLVNFGSVVARVSHSFGKQSQATVCTPTAVAAARGTGFRVLYDPQHKQTFVAVVDGTVDFKTSGVTQQTPAGQFVTAKGYQAGPPAALPATANTRISGSFQSMSRYEKPNDFLQAIEYGLNTALDPFLQILGLAPGSWSYKTCYAARKAACLEALKRLNNYMHTLPDDQLPEVVSLTTLEELNIDDKGKKQILDEFAGNMVDSYRRVGVGSWEIVVRARDKARTPFRLTESGPQEIRQ